MRFGHPVLCLCDGCGVTAEGSREIVTLGTAEAARLTPPEGWTMALLGPVAHIARIGPVQVDPFASTAQELANQTGKPVGVLVCAACQETAANRVVLAS